MNIYDKITCAQVMIAIGTYVWMLARLDGSSIASIGWFGFIVAWFVVLYLYHNTTTIPKKDELIKQNIKTIIYQVATTSVLIFVVSSMIYTLSLPISYLTTNTIVLLFAIPWCAVATRTILSWMWIFSGLIPSGAQLKRR
jgi:hypothetical protein